MPELPELEAIRQYLEVNLLNEVVSEVTTYRHTVIRSPSTSEFENLLLNAKLEQISRIGRILRFSLSKSNYVLHLFIDHGLTGRLAWHTQSQKFPKRTIFSLAFTNERNLIYHDSRSHGVIWLFKAKSSQDLEHPSIIDNYGPDILEVSDSEFHQRLKQFRGEIKGILTNQKFVTGIGNAYSDEILFEARIHPFTKRNQLHEPEIERLFLACKRVLSNSTKKISNILIKTSKLDDQHKWRQQILKVHLRGKQPCPVCEHSISTIKAYRITNFCRKCQPSKNKYFI